MASRKSRLIAWETLLAGISRAESPVEYRANCRIFQQGQPADSLLYLRRGKVKLIVISKHGKEAIVAMLSAGEFFGEGCLAGQPLRMATATAMTACTLYELEKALMTRLLHEQHEISELFVRTSALPQHPVRSGSGGPVFPLKREASGADPLAAFPFRQGKQSRACASQGQSG